MSRCSCTTYRNYCPGRHSARVCIVTPRRQPEGVIHKIQKKCRAHSGLAWSHTFRAAGCLHSQSTRTHFPTSSSVFCVDGTVLVGAARGGGTAALLDPSVRYVFVHTNVLRRQSRLGLSRRATHPGTFSSTRWLLHRNCVYVCAFGCSSSWLFGDPRPTVGPCQSSVRGTRIAAAAQRSKTSISSSTSSSSVRCVVCGGGVISPLSPCADSVWVWVLHCRVGVWHGKFWMRCVFTKPEAFLV